MISDMQAMVRVVDKGSFTAAAESMGKTPSALSRIINKLEARLGARLLHRTTRRISLTPEGELYYKRSKLILAEIADTEAEVSMTGRQLHGQIRVTCLTGFALNALAQELPKFTLLYPEIQVLVSIEDKITDLVRDEYDVGIRSGTILEPSLVARRITYFQRHIYASPRYLAQRGTPQVPADLESHTCVIPNLASSHWDFKSEGKLISVKVGGSVYTDSAEMALRTAIAGGGIVLAANFMTENEVASGRLVPLLSKYHTDQLIELSAVYPSGHLRMPKVRALIDFLVDEFRKKPWAG